MITINGEQIDSIEVVYQEWEKSGSKYTSPKGNVIFLGSGCTLGRNCKLGNDCEVGSGCEVGSNCKFPYPLWFTGIRYSIGFYKPGYINSGCITKPVQWWEDNVTRCAEEHGYTKEQTIEYEWRVKALADWMKLHGVYEPEKSDL